jgi:heme-degrading monooxygenase HmoA
MAFVVINTVRASQTDLPGIIADIHLLNLDGLRAQPGFRSARFIAAEDESEAALIVEWDSRDHFAAYRQTEEGRRIIDGAVARHPRIAFYEVITSVDSGQ